MYKYQFEKRNCLIHIKNEILNRIDNRLLLYAYNQWKLNVDLLIGLNTVNVYWNGYCKFFDKFNNTEKNIMIGSDFFITHRQVKLDFFKNPCINKKIFFFQILDIMFIDFCDTLI